MLKLYAIDYDHKNRDWLKSEPKDFAQYVDEYKARFTPKSDTRVWEDKFVENLLRIRMSEK